MLRSSLFPVLGAAAVAVTVAAAGAQQSAVTLSPFVTFLPTGSASPMAGLALTVAGGPLALRAGGHLSLKDRSALSATSTTGSMRPWGADADALAYLEGYTYGDRIGFLPYVIVGVGTTGVDSGALHLSRQGWSYGGGLTIPVGSALGLFGEARWRMSRFVMPNATDAPPSTHEFRVGISFRVGGGLVGLGDLGNVVRGMASPDDGLVSNEPVSRNSNGNAGRLISTAGKYVGTPYRRGGTTPSSGFDASGFVRFVFAQFGVTLPRTSRDQARVGERIRTDLRNIAPGDLLMFEDDGGINHVAIYVGEGRIIHSSATGGGVRYDDLSTERGRWFIEHLVAVRRVTPDLRGLLLDLARGFPTAGANDVDRPDHAPKAEMRRRH